MSMVFPSMQAQTQQNVYVNQVTVQAIDGKGNPQIASPRKTPLNKALGRHFPTNLQTVTYLAHLVLVDIY